MNGEGADHDMSPIPESPTHGRVALAGGADAAGRALVLAGGGMRVAWQAGVLARLEEQGLGFAHGDGTSGGILTLGMLLSGVTPTQMCDRWRTLETSDFVSLLPLREYLRSPSDLEAFGDADGMIERVFPHLGIDVERIRAASGMTGSFNACNFDDKLCEAVDHRDVDVDLLVAGMSLPLFMPAVRRGGVTYTDAVWIKDANLLEAVRRGATDLWLVWCIGNTPRYGNGPLEQYVHMIEMSANGALFAEFDAIRVINERRGAGEAVHGTTEPVRVHVIRPQHPLPLDPEFFFGRITAGELVAMGYRDASRYLASGVPDAGVPDHRVTRMRDHVRGVRFGERLAGSVEFVDGEVEDVELDLTVEVSDLDAFASGRTADVCGQVSIPPWGPPRLVRRGSCRVATAQTGTIEVRYDLEVPDGEGSGEALVTAVKQIHDGEPGGLYAEVTTAAVEVRAPGTDRGSKNGAVVGRGKVRLDGAGLRAMLASVTPLGAESLTDRAAIVGDAASLLLRGLAGGIQGDVMNARTGQPRFRTVRWLPLPWINAMCLPPVGVLVRAGRDSPRLRRHELVHWEQYTRRGVLRYYAGYLAAWAGAGFSYRRHPWEIEARRAETT